MKAIFRYLSIYVKQIARDSMLYVMLTVPILAGLVFRFGIPKAEHLLCEYFGQSTIVFEYYLLFDLLITVLTPFMLCFVSSMVMLSELDENMVNYLTVTPVGKKGYIISRLVIPAAFLGLPIPLLLLSDIQYTLFIISSLWIVKMVNDESFFRCPLYSYPLYGFGFCTENLGER
ncbi:MAG: hypothetical protein JW780_06275 [Clostridiales bacterium]|nr:hypothetical protein [Clostridiales bacterium]